MPVPIAAGAAAGGAAVGGAEAGAVAAGAGRAAGGAAAGEMAGVQGAGAAIRGGGGRAAMAAGRAQASLLGRAMNSLRGKPTGERALAAERITSPGSAADANASAIDEVRQFVGDTVDKWWPKFAHSITVNVRGGPRADLRRCWFLALAACFGRYTRGISGISGRSLNAQWNITGKEVSVTLAYTFSGASNTGKLESVFGAASDYTGLTLLQRGPDQVTIGAGFPRWMMTTRQLLGSGLLGWQPFPAGAAMAILAGGGLRDVGGGNNADTKLNGQGQLQNRAGGRMYSSTRVTNVDPRRLIEGWFVGNLKTDQPLAARVFQPYRFKPVPNIFRELPIRPPGGSLSPMPERLPVRRIMPGSPGFPETTEYVERGGLYGYVPLLPDDGRVITTGEKNDPRVQPPLPPVDGVSRGHPLAMITAILGNPGVLVDAPINQGNRLGGQGVFAHIPGAGVNAYDVWGFPVLGGQPHPAALDDTLNRIVQYGANRVEVPADVINVTGGG